MAVLVSLPRRPDEGPGWQDQLWSWIWRRCGSIDGNSEHISALHGPRDLWKVHAGYRWLLETRWALGRAARGVEDKERKASRVESLTGTTSC